MMRGLTARDPGVAARDQPDALRAMAGIRTLMQNIAAAGNTVVPALLALEKLGFNVSVGRDGGGRDLFEATRGDESYLAEDPVSVLGLVKLIEMRSWEWRPSDLEIDEVLKRYDLG